MVCLERSLYSSRAISDMLDLFLVVFKGLGDEKVSIVTMQHSSIGSGFISNHRDEIVEVLCL